MNWIRSFTTLLMMLLLVFVISCNDEEPVGEIIIASIQSSSEILIEGEENGYFIVSLNNSHENSIVISLEFSGSANINEDFQAIENEVSFAPGVTNVRVNLQALEDEIEEPMEEILITLQQSANPLISIGEENSVSLSLADSPKTFLPDPSDIRSYLVNPNATEETAALFYNLKALSRNRFIVGQHDAFSSFFNNNGSDSDIKKTTGDDPGLLGSDFMFIADDKNDERPENWFFQQENKIKRDVKKAYDQGMVNIFAWHLREPYSGEEFFTGNMTDFQKNNAMKSILPGGANHEYYKLKLEKIARVAKSMIASDGTLIPFIFRPFHEFDGDWFWWGKPYCTAEEFVTIWRFTVEYLRDELEVNNMLFAYSPDSKLVSESSYLNRYPGDEYVDVLGMDNYRDFNGESQFELENANNKLQIISNLAKERVKIAALTESCDFQIMGQSDTEFYSKDLYNALTENKVELSFMMFWSNNNEAYCTPPPNQPDANDFLKFIDLPKSVLSEELPDMYKFP